jgi:hypothetical protein
VSDEQAVHDQGFSTADVGVVRCEAQLGSVTMALLTGIAEQARVGVNETSF